MKVDVVKCKYGHQIMKLVEPITELVCKIMKLN